jgi:hypothetical protein
MTMNLAQGVETVLLMRMFALFSPPVRVDLSPGLSIKSTTTVSLVHSFSSLWSFMSTTNDP